MIGIAPALWIAAHFAQLQAAATPSVSSIDMVLGTGDVAAKDDLVTVDYTGNLLTGKVFDTSTGKAPFTFKLGAGEVIKGWDLGVDGMKVGGRRVLSIPAELAYGDKENGDIPAKSTLVFDIKVLGVIKSGAKQMLKIEELGAGTGPASKDGDTVEVKYAGSFLNGTPFDSGSFSFELGAGKVIKGFDQGVLGMSKGQKRRITVPPDLGYGARGAGGVIPPNATLVFDVELIDAR